MSSQPHQTGCLRRAEFSNDRSPSRHGCAPYHEHHSQVDHSYRLVSPVQLLPIQRDTHSVAAMIAQLADHELCKALPELLRREGVPSPARTSSRSSARMTSRSRPCCHLARQPGDAVKDYVVVGQAVAQQFIELAFSLALDICHQRTRAGGIHASHENSVIGKR